MHSTEFVFMRDSSCASSPSHFCPSVCLSHRWSVKSSAS